jgi:hypothetical protein
MKKKIGILLLTLLLVVTLTACRDAQTTDEERAFAAYTHYLELIGEVGGGGAWDADFTMDMSMDFMGMTIDTVSEGHSVAIITDENNMEMFMSMTTDMGMLGMSMDMEVYMTLVDGTIGEMRMILDGQEMPEVALDPDMLEDMTDTNVPLFELGDIISVEIEEEGNYTTFLLELDVTKLSDFIEEAIGSQMGDLTDMLGDDTNVTMSFGDDMFVSLVVYGDDNNPVSMAVTMEMTMGFEGEEFAEMDGEEITIRSKMEYRYNKFGDDVIMRTL